LKDAVKWGLILRNPADIVSPPRVEKKEAVAWDSDTIKKFMDAAEGCRYRDVYSLAALTGMRRSELAGLKWPDIDTKSGRLRVVRTRQRIYGHGIVEGQPKTHRSRRTVALSRSAVSVLESIKTNQIEMRLKAGPLWQHTDYIFTMENGAPIDPDNLSREFRRIVREAGLPHGTLHGLRHAYATALLSANVHPAVVQSALGHSSITLTIDTYSHVMPGLEEAAARRIDDILGDAVAGNS
jgi:integrase